MFKKLTNILIGSDERVVKKMTPMVEEVNALEAEFQGLSDEQLRAKTDEFKALVADGEDIEDLLPEAFATVREAAKRTLGQRHFDVQLMGGNVLFRGQVAEMKTGEGKTLVATLAAYLSSLDGKGVHVVTVNDYLARRDAQWMGVIYHFLGVSVGVLQHETAYLYDPEVETEEPGMESLRAVGRREAYLAEITYGTNNEFGFDFLRDNMVVDLSQRVQRELAYAIVDEVDNILIDEARTPLIISGPAQQSPNEYLRFAKLAGSLTHQVDYTVDEKHRSVSLTGEGMERLERQLKVSNLYDPANYDLVHFVENALKAEAIFHKDRQYVVKDGEVVIVDEFTGRMMAGRRYSDGVHQAIEAKEGVKVQRETITYATVTLQNYFRMYKRLAGMTGTAETEAEELWKIYKLEVVVVPTNKPMVREDYSDFVYKTEDAKFKAVVSEIEERHRRGQPVLVGTTDIDKSEVLSEMLNRKGIAHEILNAKQHAREATIVTQAGRLGAVTVATNMAGRGTDIVLGGNPAGMEISQEQWQKDHDRVVELGGLHIIGTERHDARRIDNQLRGRSGRQGDPGETRFYVALDDDLMRRFGGDRIRTIMDWAGLDDDVPIENRMITKSIGNAQVKVEAQHFDIRKHLVEYDDVVNTHRTVIYRERDKALGDSDLKANIQAMIGEELQLILDSHLADQAPQNWDTESLLREISTILPPPADLADPDELAEMPAQQIDERFLAHARQLYEAMEEEVEPERMRSVERQVMLRGIDINWVQHLTSMENLRQGIGLQAYGQRDPLVMYKSTGHELFQALQDNVRRNVVQTIHHVSVTPAGNGRRGQARPQRSVGRESAMSRVVGQHGREAVAAGSRKVGRNQACPCGSGKKYKRCHGA